MIQKKLKMFPVNDSSLKQLKKICYKDILSMFTEIFKNEQIQFVCIDVIWAKFEDEISKEFQINSPRKDKMHAMYVMEFQDKEENDLWGYYQPFSGKFYIVDKSLMLDAEDCIAENVQFPLGYCKNNIKYNLFEVARNSRCFKVRRKWFSIEKKLVACEDRTTIKTMHSTQETSAVDDFHYGDVLAMEIKHYKPMHIIN